MPLDPREQAAASNNQMITNKEASIRKGAGLAVMGIVTALAVLQGPALIGPASFAVLFGSGIGVFETGRVNL